MGKRSDVLGGVQLRVWQRLVSPAMLASSSMTETQEATVERRRPQQQHREVHEAYLLYGTIVRTNKKE